MLKVGNTIPDVLRSRGNVLTNLWLSKRFRPLLALLVLVLAACGDDPAGEEADPSQKAPRPAIVGPSYPEDPTGPAITEVDLPKKPATPAQRIDFYVALLGGGDQEEVAWATEMLGRAGVRASGALGDRLAEALTRNALLAENILNVFHGTVPAGEALPRIVEAAQSRWDRVRMAAAIALGWVDEEETIPLLLDLATDGSPLVARGALKSIARRKSASAARGLRGRFATTLSPSHRPTAIRTIGRSLPKEEAIAFLKPFLEEEDLTLAIPAAHTLRERGVDTGADVLYARFKKGGLYPQLMDGLLQALTEFADPRVLPMLLEALGEGTLPKRITAAALLGSYSTPEVREALRRASQDPIPELRREAWHSLRLGGDTGVISGLRLLLRSEEPADRRIAAVLLGEFKATEAAADLVGALEHERERSVTMDLAHALAKLDIPESAVSVVRALEQETEDLPSLAILANNVASALLLYERISDKACTELARVSGSKKASLRMNAVRAMARHGRGDACREALLARMTDADVGVRETAARSWIGFPGAGVEPLLEMLERESRPTRARTIAELAQRLAHRWEE